MPIVCSPPYPSLDALTTAPAWIRSVEPPHLHDFRLDVSPQVEVASSISAKKHSDDNALARTIRSTIEAVCNCLVYQASYLNELDAQVGDGDLGTSLALGANNVLNSLDSLDFADVSSTFQQVALLLRKSMGGSSGPLFSMFFLRFSQALHQAEPTQPNTWIQAFEVIFSFADYQQIKFKKSTYTFGVPERYRRD